MTIFGEWCGPGVEKKAAIAKHDRKIFAVFAAQVGYEEDGNAPLRAVHRELRSEMDDLSHRLDAPDRTG